MLFRGSIELDAVSGAGLDEDLGCIGFGMGTILRFLVESLLPPSELSLALRKVDSSIEGDNNENDENAGLE